MGFYDFFIKRRETQSSRKAFIPYFTLGDPGFEESREIISACIESGADALELGFPFSDPIADGPVIQRANQRALISGMNTDKCFELLSEIRKRTDIPIGILTYYNLIFKYGVDRFCRVARDSGIQGILAADLPVEESKEFCGALANHGIESVFMIAINTDAERMRKIISNTTGYLYIVAVLGVTGARESVSSRCIEAIASVRRLTSLPLCVGFGISTPSHAKMFRNTEADGIIAGSAIISLIERNLPDISVVCEKVSLFVKGFTQGGS